MECEECVRVRLVGSVGSCNVQGGAFGSWGTFSLQVSRGSRGHDNWPGIIIPRQLSCPREPRLTWREKVP